MYQNAFQVSSKMLNKIVMFCCFLSIIRPSRSKFYVTNVTDYNKCQIYHDHGDIPYQYTEFYRLMDNPEPDSILDFHFSINSSSNVHILLAPYAEIWIGDAAYQISIDVGDDNLLNVRKISQKTGVKDFSKFIKGVLPKLRLRSFWIHISKNGVIKIGKEGNEGPLLSWADPDQNPLPVKILSFSSFLKNGSNFYFDCPRDDNMMKQSTVLIPSSPSLLESTRWLLPSHSDPLRTTSAPKLTSVPVIQTRNALPSNSAGGIPNYGITIEKIAFLIILNLAFLIIYD